MPLRTICHCEPPAPGWVGVLRRRNYGALDMAGNIYEWVAGWFSDTYYQTSPADNPPGPSAPDSRNSRTIRGGSWGNLARIIRSAARDNVGNGTGGQNFGFRCAAMP